MTFLRKKYSYTDRGDSSTQGSFDKAKGPDANEAEGSFERTGEYPGGYGRGPVRHAR